MNLDLNRLWNFSDPAASEARFAALLEDAAVRISPRLRGEVLSQIARARGLQRRFDEAEASLAAAAEIAGDADSRAALCILLERGRVLNTSGRGQESKGPFTRAWEMAGRLGEEALAVDAAHMLGIVEPDERGFEWTRRALTMAEGSNDPAARRWTASLRNNIAWWLHDRGRYEEALAEFARALEEREEQGVRGAVLVARWMVARCLRSMGRLEEALAMQMELRREHEQEGSKDGFVSEEIGECLLALGRRVEANEHFRRAYEVLAEDVHLIANEGDRLARLAKLGGVR